MQGEEGMLIDVFVRERESERAGQRGAEPIDELHAALQGNKILPILNSKKK